MNFICFVCDYWKTSPSRIWTSDPMVNSHLLYHWAIEEFSLKKVEDGIEPSLSDLQSHTLAIMLLNLLSLILYIIPFSKKRIVRRLIKYHYSQTLTVDSWLFRHFIVFYRIFDRIEWEIFHYILYNEYQIEKSIICMVQRNL